MDCNETRRLLDAAIDGELDLVRALELETHLRGCADCARIAEAGRARQTVLRTSLPRFAAPSSLARKIRTDLVAGTKAPPARKWFDFGWTWAAMPACLALALAAGYLWGGARARTDTLLDEAISDHVRALQTGHLLDVVSTDQHTVKPWFTGKLDFSPPVVDLAKVGFALEGGRLEYIDGRPAAALVFRRRKHPINLFIWPAGSGHLSNLHALHDGYSAQMWRTGDMNFLAVSEIPTNELTEFITAYRSATR